MMTRTTLKTLWFGGGGILATWLAVSPNDGVAVRQPETTLPRPAASNEATADDLNALAARLRDRHAAVALRPSTRNPFRYSSSRSVPRSTVPSDRALQPANIQLVIPTPPSPQLKLSGVAQKAGKRTAVISGDGQIYLVAEGESVAGRYTVVKIDPEAVLLRDDTGAEQRLVLPQ